MIYEKGKDYEKKWYEKTNSMDEGYLLVICHESFVI